MQKRYFEMKQQDRVASTLVSIEKQSVSPAGKRLPQIDNSSKFQKPRSTNKLAMTDVKKRNKYESNTLGVKMETAIDAASNLINRTDNNDSIQVYKKALSNIA